MLRTISSHWIFGLISPLMWTIFVMLMAHLWAPLVWPALALCGFFTALKIGFFKKKLSFIYYYKHWPYYGKFWVYLLFLNDPLINEIKYRGLADFQSTRILWYDKSSFSEYYIYHSGVFKFIWILFYKSLGYPAKEFRIRNSPYRLALIYKHRTIKMVLPCNYKEFKSKYIFNDKYLYDAKVCQRE